MVEGSRESIASKGSTFKKALKFCDMLGFQPSLNYNHAPQYTSPFGGLVTLIAYLGVFAYFIALLVVVIKRENYQVTSQLKIRDQKYD